MTRYVSVDTAQNVKLNYELAGLGPRIIAFIIDMLIKGAYVILLAFIMVSLADNFYLTDDTALVVGFIFALPFIFYSFILETLYNGQTPGKKAMKIKVVRVDGMSPTIGNYFMRWIMRMVDIQLFYGLPALISIAASKYGQRLGDMAAGTTVINLGRNVKLEDISVSLPKEPEAYIPTYPEVIKLKDKDIEIIKQILKNASRNQNIEALSATALKIKDITGINNVTQNDTDFLKTIIDDYTYYSNMYQE